MVTMEAAHGVRQIGGVLQFRAPKVEDAGIYVCVVSNSAGEAQVELELVITRK